MNPRVETEPRVEKLYYSISEVSEAAGVRPHVLRYWETQFKMLRPQKNRAGNRQYRKKELNLVLTIRDLLYHQGYTIAGARRKLLEARRSGEVEDGRLVRASDLVHEPSPAPFDAGPEVVSPREGLAVVRPGPRTNTPPADGAIPKEAPPVPATAQLSLTNPTRQATIREVREELHAILSVLDRTSVAKS